LTIYNKFVKQNACIHELLAPYAPIKHCWWHY